jgi:hypothetical protein
MTLVNTDTGEITQSLSLSEAERISNRISLRLETIADNYEAVVPMIREAIERRAWEILGYRSPGEYAADRFGGAMSRLGVEFRQAVVRELSELGMSTRAIAPVVGVHHDTVASDIKSAPTVGDPTVGEPPAPITGLNGKTYSRPAPIDPVAQIKAAVIEFPDLAYYVDTGRTRDVLLMADDLRDYRRRGELDERLDTLRRSIAVDRAKRDGTYQAGTTAVLGDDGKYRMAPLPTPAATTRTCPTCSGRGVIEESAQ